MVYAQNREGSLTKIRALLDTCSTVNLITKRCIQLLKIPTRECLASVVAIDELGTMARACVTIQLRSTYTSFEKSIDCLVVDKISEREPSEPFPRDKINLPRGLPLADPQFYKPRPVDVLLGAGLTVSLIQPGQLNLNSIHSELWLQKTRFGWTIVGGFGKTKNSNIESCHLTKMQALIEKFWIIEEIGGKSETASEDSLCELHYTKTTTRDESGRYMVRLPFRHDSFELGDSRTQALRRFYSLEKKLEANAILKSEYHKVMQEYIHLGHMSLVENETENGYYLPQHAVIKTSSTTTKLRVVFDASARTSNGLSLNKVLMTGPSIQDKLFEHLIKFRTHVFVIIADIERMYRQINVHPDDRKFQRIFWYNNNKIAVYSLNTVTFGVSASPFLAIRTLKQLAEDESRDFPRASQILKRDVYVDDLLTGANSLQEILQIRDNLISLLRRGGFTIRKWGSNHSHALDNIHEKIIGADNLTEEGDVSKPLGIVWNSKSDQFIYTVNPIDTNVKFTKRYILSEISKIFDPLGLLGPIILTAKILMQECWKSTEGWDDVVSLELSRKWFAFAQQLNAMRQFNINRRIIINEPRDIQIHGFCDASKSGYGACIYLRSLNARGDVYVNLICSKSRVTPLKTETYTIPRLELCGALLLTKLFTSIEKLLNINHSRVTLWTDSTIVIHWLKKSPQTLKIFEANRVKEIQKLGDKVVWRHVNTHQNPADAISRGQYPSEFSQNKNWFSGPDWLHRSEEFWPAAGTIEILSNENTTANRTFLTKSITRSFYSNCSSYGKILNFIALILRALKRKSFKSRQGEGPITVTERKEAEVKILAIIQREQFSKEIDELQKTGATKSSKLSALDPFIDENGILRVGGRLRHSGLSYGTKFPILLPSYHHVTDLIIASAHLRLYHAGNMSTLFHIRQRFYLLDGKNQVRKIIRACINCFRHRPVQIQTKMSDLPPPRVNATAPFQTVGVDFFGPIFIKEKKYRNLKRIKTYGCVFICMATKAVHIEIAIDLSSEGFLAAFRRFIARRSIPSDVYSDNGTNFVGANSQLRELYHLLNSRNFHDQLHSFATQKNISWHFNPPESPHFGGIWEAAVKSFKHHLKRVIGDKLLTFEEIYTFAVEIEAILNSRPLYSISTDPNDPLAITPGHLLVGRPLTLLPEENLISVSANRLSIYQFISRARQDFWRRWYVEYLSELQRRQKWIKNKGEIKKGSVVVMLEKQSPCGKWPLGLVVDVFPGSDGVTRVALIRTPQGTYTRNFTKICPLPEPEEKL